MTGVTGALLSFFGDFLLGEGDLCAGLRFLGVAATCSYSSAASSCSLEEEEEEGSCVYKVTRASRVLERVFILC